MLRVAKWVVRALLILNLVVGVPLLLLLIWSFLDEPRWLAAAARAFPGSNAVELLAGGRWALAAIAPTMAAAHVLFRKLLAILNTVSAGEPFIAVNADRLRLIAWCLLTIQLCDLWFGWASTRMDHATGQTVSGWSPDLTGWLAILLLFVLARVFREGTRLRDDAELTI